MPDVAFLLKVSRPRFWFYIFGPYIVGLAAAAGSKSDLLTWRAALFAIYFLFPANLLIYGINDIFDHETDKLNQKKTGYEALVGPDRRRSLALWILVTNLPFIAGAVILLPRTLVSLLGFLFFSIFYSSPPIRAKAIPFLDSCFNILYVFPGIFAYQMLADTMPPVRLMVAAGLWTAAMHAYSAIPDIDADRRAGVSTIATVCGPYGTLAICSLLYLAAAVISFEYLGLVSVSLGSIYLILMLASLRSVKYGRLFRLYRSFPIINVLTGAVIFWSIALEKFI
jgi:4-hydroxybenzoate polyprenyltransferase